MSPQRAIHSALRAVAITMGVVYVLWNLYFLAQARVPPSLLLGLTGLPSPTSGGTRSLLCLVRGDWRESLACNALTVPIGALFLHSVGTVLLQALRRRRLALPAWSLPAWLILLAVAWILKLTGSPEYW